MSVPEPDARARLREIVGRWLDDLDTPEPPPEGVAPEVLTSAEEAPDLATLLGQLVALTREVQLQGRATNRLHADLSAAVEHMNQSPTPARQLAEARREARHEVVGELLEVRDRLTRGLDEARRRLASLRGLRARLGQRPLLTALLEGVAWRASGSTTRFAGSTCTRSRATASPSIRRSCGPWRSWRPRPRRRAP